jgi:hypothetical protein
MKKFITLVFPSSLKTFTHACIASTTLVNGFQFPIIIQPAEMPKKSDK